MITFLSFFLFVAFHVSPVRALRLNTKLDASIRNKNGEAKPLNVVMGFAAGPGYYTQTKLFVKSLRGTGYNGDIILGTDPDITPEWMDFFVRNNVTIRRVEGHKCATAYNGEHCIDLDGRGTEASMNFARYHIFQTWLKDYNANDLVMMSDVRDVYFQANPFSNNALQRGITNGDDLFVFEESRPDTMSNFTWTHPTKWNFNRGWLFACWGEGVVKQAAPFRVSCSGTTMGTKPGVTSYLQAMTTEMTERSQLREKSNCPGWVNEECDCRTGGVDQGYHNFLLSSGKLRDLRVKRFAAGTGPVNTVGVICSNEDGEFQDALPLDQEGHVLNPDGTKSDVVHQYDRCDFPQGWARN